MARVWVKGYTKADGTKVPGHYREMGVHSQHASASGSGNKRAFYGFGTFKRTARKVKDAERAIKAKYPQKGLLPPAERQKALWRLEYRSGITRRFRAVRSAVQKTW